MKRIARLALGALAITATATTAVAQEDAQAPVPQAEGFFGKPAFVLMPGTFSAPVLSEAGEDTDADTKTYFNARFMTVVPTRLEWFQLVAGAQWLPNGARAISPTGVRGGRATQPNIFYGAIIPFVPFNKATNGWLNLSIDPLGLYYMGGGGTSDNYGHDFVLEGAAVIPIGQKMFPAMSFFGNVSAYVLLDQILTHQPVKANGDRDYWSPLLLTGLIIPIGQ
jgi:hypothetical protein